MNGCRANIEKSTIARKSHDNHPNPGSLRLNHQFRVCYREPTFNEARALGSTISESVILMPTSMPTETSELFNRGLAKLEARDYSGAEEIFRRVLAVTPNSAEAHNNLAMALVELGRLVDATGHLRLVVTLIPNYALAHFNLGVVLGRLGHVSEAVDCYMHAVALAPQNPNMRNNLADALWTLGKLEEAMKHARRAVALNPDDAGNYITLGNVLQDLMQVKEAVRSFRHSIALRPSDATAHNNLGFALMKLGRFDEAIKAIENAIKIDPRFAVAYLNIVQCRKLEPDDPHLATMEMLVRETENLPRSDRRKIHFALGMAYGDLRMHERAFGHLLKANALKRQDIKYDVRLDVEYFRRIEAIFSAALIQQKQGMGNLSRLPVFILGMPRSGSTLVEQILARHPKVHGAGELSDFAEVVLEEAKTAQIAGRYPDITADFGPEHFQAVGQKYIERLRKLSNKAERITDKAPSNFEYVGLILLTFPNATIVHTVRNEVDTCLSCFAQDFQRSQNYSYDLVELGRYYRAYRDLMDHWNRVVPLGRILDVRYEDVVGDLEGAARRIVAHCGLEWDDACLSFHESDRPILTASAVQVRQPIYRHAVGRWVAYKNFLQPLLNELKSG